jgi:FkbM family methyltransferase
MTDKLGPFLYRRFAGLSWCEFRLPGQGSARGKIRLKSKWDVASFQDVFCHPYYWQALAHMSDPPSLIVDAGAHCGHFSVMVDICARTQFENAPLPKFVLVEPNPWLQPVLERNLQGAGLSGRATVHQGLLGRRDGRGTLFVDGNNYLASGQENAAGRIPVEQTFIDLTQVLPAGPIDVMKLDIEGGEFEFVVHNPDVLDRVKLLVAEVHCDRVRYEGEFVPAVAKSGLRPVGPPMIGHAGCQLATLKRG